LAVKVHYAFTTVREKKYTSQHCCDKTMDDKMALYRAAVTKQWTTKWPYIANAVFRIVLNYGE